MSIVRHIAYNELESFAKFAACQDRGFAPAKALKFERWLRDLWANGESSPEYCWVAENDGLPMAAIVLWMRGGKAHIEHFKPCASEDSTNLQLLMGSLAGLKASGAPGVWAEVISPPLPEENADLFSSLLIESGFQLTRYQFRFHKKAKVTKTNAPELIYKSCTEMDVETIISAWEQVQAQSLDYDVVIPTTPQASRARAADCYLMASYGLNDVRLWELAYLADGSLVGLIAPGFVKGEPVINYYGVSPEHRSRGYGRRLLARGVSSLASAGAKSVRLDVQAINDPSLRAVRAAGFKQIRCFRNFELSFLPNRS